MARQKAKAGFPASLVEWVRWKSDHILFKKRSLHSCFVCLLLNGDDDELAYGVVWFLPTLCMMVLFSFFFSILTCSNHLSKISTITFISFEFHSNDEDRGAAVLFSSIRNVSHYQDHSAPFPIIVATSRHHGTGQIGIGSPVCKPDLYLLKFWFPFRCHHPEFIEWPSSFCGTCKPNQSKMNLRQRNSEFGIHHVRQSLVFFFSGEGGGTKYWRSLKQRSECVYTYRLSGYKYAWWFSITWQLLRKG